jgi:hypothetical protein
MKKISDFGSYKTLRQIITELSKLQQIVIQNKLRLADVVIGLSMKSNLHKLKQNKLRKGVKCNLSI